MQPTPASIQPRSISAAEMQKLVPGLSIQAIRKLEETVRQKWPQFAKLWNIDPGAVSGLDPLSQQTGRPGACISQNDHRRLTPNPA